MVGWLSPDKGLKSHTKIIESIKIPVLYNHFLKIMSDIGSYIKRDLEDVEGGGPLSAWKPALTPFHTVIYLTASQTGMSSMWNMHVELDSVTFMKV